jgi:hypothetical protein
MASCLMWKVTSGNNIMPDNVGLKFIHQDKGVNTVDIEAYACIAHRYKNDCLVLLV